ncbi:GNAT family N-acetyltransferase [Demequina globuliformis]|uniref:GNAT family N-acetyltransferase n=1 Tax=Demequina globuliformis TaxID=676202 RepID=UPI000B00B5AC|nr:GNAT family N-acetyltransferase [Demequina globuliformis]
MRDEDLHASAPLRSSANKEPQNSASRAGVVIRSLSPGQVGDATALLTRMWGAPVVEAPLMVALGHAGNYVAGAFLEEELVGVCVAYFSQPLGHALHSHVTGVAPHAARRGVGMALKMHQRAWALERGLTQVTWTFDPLVARNAAFNLNRLRVEVAEYLVDFYGDMSDGVNRGQTSDRLLARWDLTQPVVSTPHGDSRTALPQASALVTEGRDGMPRMTVSHPQAAAISVAVPRDIESLRAHRPAAARAWRTAVREALGPAMRGGWTITSFTDHHYVLEAPDAD